MKNTFILTLAFIILCFFVPPSKVAACAACQTQSFTPVCSDQNVCNTSCTSHDWYDCGTYDSTCCFRDPDTMIRVCERCTRTRYCQGGCIEWGTSCSIQNVCNSIEVCSGGCNAATETCQNGTCVANAGSYTCSGTTQITCSNGLPGHEWVQCTLPCGGGGDCTTVNDCNTQVNECPNGAGDCPNAVPVVGDCQSEVGASCTKWDQCGCANNCSKSCQNGTCVYNSSSCGSGQSCTCSDGSACPGGNVANCSACATTLPNAPGLLSPSNHATGQSTSLPLSMDWANWTFAKWMEGCPNNNNFIFYADTNANPSTVKCTFTAVGPTTNFISHDCTVSGLAYGTKYYWKVRACNKGASNCTDSPVWDFTTKDIGGWWQAVGGGDIYGVNVQSVIPDTVPAEKRFIILN